MSIHAGVSVHPSAVVEQGAQLGTGVIVGPFCYVGAGVVLGNGCRLHSHAVVDGNTVLGSDNEIYPFASIGKAPQDLKYKGENTQLIIGNKNTIRECVTLQPGTVQGGGRTVIGDQNLFMAYTHVAHDCMVGSRNIFANCAQLAGHVEIADGAIVSAHSAIHQFCRVGPLAMTAAGAMLSQDLPPYCQAQGDRATLVGLNLVGLKRSGTKTEDIQKIKATYKILFWGGHPTVDEAVAACSALTLDSHPLSLQLITFVKNSKRGVVRPAREGSGEEDSLA